VSNQLLLIHYILQSKQTDDKIFSKASNIFSPRSLAEGSQAQNFLTDPRNKKLTEAEHVESAGEAGMVVYYTDRVQVAGAVRTSTSSLSLVINNTDFMTMSTSLHATHSPGHI